MIKRNLRTFGSEALGLLLLLFLTTCSNDSEPSGPDVDECEGEDVFGPAGGTIEITDTKSVFYGLRIVIPAGVLEDCRSFYINEGFASGFPNGGIAYPMSKAQFDLSTGGDKPYEMALEFYFPMKGMAIDSTETPCAFAYDERVGKWSPVLPDSYDGTTMMVKTTYRDKWTWGKMELEVISTENMIDAVIEKYGEEEWTTAVGGIAKAIDVMKTLYVDRTCQTWIRMRDTDLPNLIQIKKGSMQSYQSQIGICGTCDLFSDQFGLELSKYIVAKIVILTADLWDLFVGDWAGYMPFLSDVDMLMSMQRYIALAFIWQQECDYTCVTKKIGLGVYETYAMYYVYSATQLMVTLAIEDGFWVSCP